MGIYTRPRGAGVRWLGAYDSSERYRPGDIVLYNEYTYIANDISIGNLPTNTDYWDSGWAAGEATGDMVKSTYDPNNINDDAFDMGNMEEGTTNKIFSATERTKLSGIQSGAEVNDSAATIKTKYESNNNTNAYTDSEKLKVANIPDDTTTELSNKIDKTTNVDNTIMRADGIEGDLQDSKIKIDDDGNIILTEDGTQEIANETYPLQDLTFKDENGLVITIRKLWGLHRDYAEEASFLPFSISCDVTGGVWTCTITDTSGSGYLAFGLDDKDLRSPGPTLSVNATAYAGNATTSKTVYIYVQNNGSDVPELVASNTNPEGVVTHVHIATYETGAVSTSSVNVLGKADSIIQTYKLASKVYHRAFLDGPRYGSGLNTTATSTDLTIGVGNYILIFDSITTVERTVGTDGLFYFKNDGTYGESTDFSFDGEYGDGVTIDNNKYFNVILGVVEDDTTRIMGVVQNGTSQEYVSFSDAFSDIYNQTSYYPSNTFLKNIFVPVARIIIKKTSTTYTLQQFDDGNYFQDIRGLRQAGGSGSGGTSNVLDGNVENDFTLWNATNGQYEPSTVAETKTVLNLSGTNTGDQDLSGYELLSNKKTDIDANKTSDTFYASCKAIYDWATGLFATKANVLELDNTTSFTPDADYEPATKKYVDDNAGGGGTSFWTAIPGTPTRVSNTQFTITGNYVNIFTKGMIIQWQESTNYRCGMVVSSSYSSPNTTINISGDEMASIDSDSAKYTSDSADMMLFVSGGAIGAIGTGYTNSRTAFKVYRVLGADMSVEEVASTSGNTVIDINKGGSTMFSTKPTLAYNSQYLTATQTPTTNQSLNIGDKITVDVDTVTVTTFPTDLYVYLYVFPTYKLYLD